MVNERTSLEKRVQALEDKEEILRTMYQYAHAWDYDRGDPTNFVDCFTEDGVMYTTIEGKYAGSGGARKEGRKELGEWISRNPDRYGPGRICKHCMVEPEIRLDGDRATVRSYFIIVHEAPEGPHIYSMGQYLDQWVRCADGRWRIKERHLEREGVIKSAQDRTAG